MANRNIAKKILASAIAYTHQEIADAKLPSEITDVMAEVQAKTVKIKGCPIPVDQLVFHWWKTENASYPIVSSFAFIIRRRLQELGFIKRENPEARLERLRTPLPREVIVFTDQNRWIERELHTIFMQYECKSSVVQERAKRLIYELWIAHGRPDESDFFRRTIEERLNLFFMRGGESEICRTTGKESKDVSILGLGSFPKDELELDFPNFNDRLKRSNVTLLLGVDENGKIVIE